MLELRPTCENCNKALPPESLEARICTYECTFCADCVDGVLGGRCPNCGQLCEWQFAENVIPWNELGHLAGWAD